jgi:hypothetical protein
MAIAPEPSKQAPNGIKASNPPQTWFDFLTVLGTEAEKTMCSFDFPLFLCPQFFR